MPHPPLKRPLVRTTLFVECLEDRNLLSASKLTSFLDLGDRPNLSPGLVRLINNLIEVHDNAPARGAVSGLDWLSDQFDDDRDQRDEDRGKDKNDRNDKKDRNSSGKKDDDRSSVVSQSFNKTRDIVNVVSTARGTGATLAPVVASQSVAAPAATTPAASPASPAAPPPQAVAAAASVEPPLPLVADDGVELATATASRLVETEQSLNENGAATAPRETKTFSMEKDLARSTLPQFGGWSMGPISASRLAGSYSDSEIPLVVSEEDCEESKPAAPQGEVPMVADLMAANAFGIAPNLDGLLDRLNQQREWEMVEASGPSVPGWLVAAALALASCEVARRQMRRAAARARETDSEPSISWSLSFSGTGSAI